MKTVNSLAVVMIAFKLGLDREDEVNEETKHNVLKMVETFGDGMSPVQFYQYLQIK